MIRQTKNYLVGALSGATLIGVAIAAFVVIVSAQVFHQWPIAGTGSDTDKATVAPEKALDASPASDATASIGVAPALPAKARSTGRGAGDRPAAANPPVTDVSGSTEPVDSSGPTDESESPSSPGAEPPRPSPSSDPSSSTSGNGAPGAGDTTSAASTGSRGVTAPSVPTGNGGAPTRSPESGTTVETPVGAVKVPPVAETVNETVHGVDETVTGGALEKTGVTEATEGVVNEVAGPETPVGKTVEGATEAVTGLLGGQ